MWLSRQTLNVNSAPSIENATVTLNNDGKLEAVSSSAGRSVKVYAPYGYSFSLPKGSRLLMTRTGGEQVSFASEMENTTQEEGEIKIASAFGNYIHLKKDGSVIINGLKINSKGEIE